MEYSVMFQDRNVVFNPIKVTSIPINLNIYNLFDVGNTQNVLSCVLARTWERRRLPCYGWEVNEPIDHGM